MSYEQLEQKFNEKKELKFKLYSLEYIIKEIDNGIVEIYATSYESRKLRYNSFKEALYNYRVYNEAIIEVLNRVQILEETA